MTNTNTEQGYMGKYLRNYETKLSLSHLWHRLISPFADITTQKRFPDVSFYQGNINFDIMRGSTDAVIIRAGQRTWVDTKFSRNYSEAKRAGMKRGVYWFYDDREFPFTQANLLIGLIQGDLPEMEIIADWENTYGGPYNKLSHVTEFMKWIEAAFPTARVGIYTGFYWFKDHAILSEFEYLKTKPLWLAWYTNNPANVLIPTPWTELTHWQWGTPTEGKVYGTETNNIDMNYFNGTLAEFEARYPAVVTPPQVDDVLLSEREYFDGAIERKIEMDTPHGRTIYNLTVIETAKVEKFFVTPQKSDRDYVPEMLENYGLDFCINLDAWTSTSSIPLTPAGYNASEGKPYGPTNQTETVWVSKANVFSFTRPSILWNALSVQNRLVIEGVIPYIDKSLYDIRARTAIGWTQDQTKVFLLTVDGGDHWSNDGLNFHDTAEILLKLGCHYAFMHDGGASTAKAVNDNGVAKVIGETCGADSADTIDGYKYDKPLERVVNGFGVIMKSGAVSQPPEGDGMDEYLVLLDPTPRFTADMYETRTLPKLKPGTKFFAMATKTITVLDPGKPLNMGVKFIQIESSKYWVPEIYQQKAWVKKIGTADDPPLVAKPVKSVTTFSDGSVYIADTFIKE